MRIYLLMAVLAAVIPPAIILAPAPTPSQDAQIAERPLDEPLTHPIQLVFGYRDVDRSSIVLGSCWTPWIQISADEWRATCRAGASDCQTAFSLVGIPGTVIEPLACATGYTMHLHRAAERWDLFQYTSAFH